MKTQTLHRLSYLFFAVFIFAFVYNALFIHGGLQAEMFEYLFAAWMFLFLYLIYAFAIHDLDTSKLIHNEKLSQYRLVLDLFRDSGYLVYKIDETSYRVVLGDKFNLVIELGKDIKVSVEPLSEEVKR